VANFADLTIDDGQATPVAQTFKTESAENTLCKWYIDTTTYEGRKRLSVGRRLGTSKNPNYKSTLRVQVPHLTTPADGSAPKVDYTCLLSLDVVVPGNAEAADIADAFAFFVNALSNSDVEAALKGDGYWY
jgi:hypothetical protein